MPTNVGLSSLGRARLLDAGRRGRVALLAPQDLQALRAVVVTPQVRAAAKQKVAAARDAKLRAIRARRAPALVAKLQHAEVVRGHVRTVLDTIKQRRRAPDSKDVLARWAALSRAARPATDAELLVLARGKRAAAASPSRFIVRASRPSSMAAFEADVRKAYGLAAGARLSDAGVSVDTLFASFKTDTYFVVTLNSSRAATRPERFHIATALRVLGGFASVQPEKLEDASLYPPGVGPVDVLDIFDPASDTEWPLNAMRVREAWAKPLPAGGKAQGEGVVIGHPDSGWREHPQYDSARIDRARSFNVLTGNKGPDAAVHGPIDMTHGSATGSCMVSAPAAPGTTNVTHLPTEPGKPVRDPVQITGVSPKATVVPVRCVDSVLLIGDRNLARAIEYLAGIGAGALAKPVDVMSISLGGSPNAALEDVVKTAVKDKGVIVVAAAGQLQVVPDLLMLNDVAEPGAYQDVVCVAATTRKNRAWSPSLRGPAVDISAPGAGVYCADFAAGGEPTIVCSNGSSFSTAFVASAAAIWLAYWGRDRLDAAYPRTPLAHVFRHLIMKTANPARFVDRSGPIPVNEPWNPKLFGAGIIDVAALLDAGLPAESSIAAPPKQEENVLSWIGDGFNAIEEGLREAGDAIADAREEVYSFFRDSPQLTAALAAAAVLQAQRDAKAVQDALTKQLEDAESALAGLVGGAKAKAEQVARDAEKALDEVTEAVEEAEEDVAEAIDQVADAVEDVVETGASTLSTATNAVVGFFSSLF